MENQEKKIKMPYVASDSIIKIEVSGAYLKRCQMLLLALGQDMGEEQLKLALQKFKDTSEIPNDIREAVFFVLMSLVAEIERGATEQNKVEDKELSRSEVDGMFGTSGN